MSDKSKQDDLQDEKDDILDSSEEDVSASVGNKKSEPGQQKKKIVMAVALVIGVVIVAQVMFSGGNNKRGDDKPERESVVQDDTDVSGILSNVEKKLNTKDKPVIQQASQQKPEQKPAEKQKEEMAQLFDDRAAKQAAAERKMRMNAPSTVGIKHNRLPDEQRSHMRDIKQAESGIAGDTPYSDFTENQPVTVTVAKATKMPHPCWTVAKGEFLWGALSVAIRTDTPGMIEAYLALPAYSYKCDNVLMPAGTRLTGQFSVKSGNGMATEVIYAVWNEATLPDGTRVTLNSGITDGLGRSGIAASDVDRHFWQMFGTSALLSIIGAAASTAGPQTFYPTAQSQYQAGITQSFADTSQKVLDRNSNINPTLYLDQGTEMNVFLNRDLDFYGVYHGGGA
jgi:type IV secretion system protein VirB10